MDVLIQKLSSRKLWISVFFIIIAAIDKDLATSVAPIVVTYLVANGIQNGLSGMNNSK